MTILAVENLGFSYPDGTCAVAGVSFAVARGEHVAVVGANGAGKSTLLWHLNGLLTGSGRVVVDGVALSRSSVAAIRRQVGLVFQDPDDQLFCPTVAEDVAFGPRQARLPGGEVQRRVDAALAAVGLNGLGHKAPHHLSLGQRKRAAIAAVLAMEPAILVMDEPTSGLDPRGRRELVTLLADLGCTLVIATHDLSLLATLCPRVLVLAEGRLLADTASASLLADEALMDAAGLR